MKSEMERDILKVLVTEEELKAASPKWARSCMSSFMARTRCFWAC